MPGLLRPSSQRAARLDTSFQGAPPHRVRAAEMALFLHNVFSRFTHTSAISAAFSAE